MLYALEIDGDFWFCDTSTRFGPGYGLVTDKKAFQRCLEDYLQETEIECPLPRSSAPWNFYCGKTENGIKQGERELIVSLHRSDKDALWELSQWVSGSSTCLRIKADY
jgi:hypothetical protein